MITKYDVHVYKINKLVMNSIIVTEDDNLSQSTINPNQNIFYVKIMQSLATLLTAQKHSDMSSSTKSKKV